MVDPVPSSSCSYQSLSLVGLHPRCKEEKGVRKKFMCVCVSVCGEKAHGGGELRGGGSWGCERSLMGV